METEGEGGGANRAPTLGRLQQAAGPTYGQRLRPKPDPPGRPTRLAGYASGESGATAPGPP